MAVNPMIAMGVKIPDFDTSDTRLREAQAQNLEQQALERERARKQEEETLKLVQQYGSDITPETLKTIAAKNPRAALQMQAIASKQQADRLAAEKAAFDKEESQLKVADAKRKAQREQIQEWSNLASGITDEASYYRAIKLGLDRGLPIEVAKQLAQTPYDPKNVQQFSQQFMTAKERLDLEEALEKKEYEAKRRPQELAKLGAEVTNVTRGADGLTPGERVTQNAPTAEQKNFKEFYQQYIAANNLPDSPKSYLAARQEFEKKPVTPVPGRDIPLPKEVEDQRKRMAAAGRPVAPALTDDAIDMAAMQFAKTGVMPPLGMGNTAARTEIINRAAEIAPGGDIAANKASYLADSRSLAQQQKTYDAILAFENTALSNLDIFLENAKEVLDTKSPMLNKPFRQLSSSIVGSDKQAAFNTARQVAANEFAKLLTNPGSNAALSDSARKEIEELVNPNATLGQLVAVANVLKRDAENRKKSTLQQIEATKQRISGGATEKPKVKILKVEDAR